jgi:hypothetical protein
MGLTIHRTTTSSSSSSSIPSIRAEQQGPGVIDEARLRELRKRRNLIILLVGHDIERITVWNNPLNRISMQIPEDQKFKYDSLPKNLKSTWRDFILILYTSHATMHNKNSRQCSRQTHDKRAIHTLHSDFFSLIKV